MLQNFEPYTIQKFIQKDFCILEVLGEGLTSRVYKVRLEETAYLSDMGQ